MTWFQSDKLVKGNWLDLEGAKAFIKEYRDWVNSDEGKSERKYSGALLNAPSFEEFIEEVYKHDVHISALALKDFISKVWTEEYPFSGFYWTPAGCEWLTHYDRKAIQKYYKDGEIDCLYMFSYHIGYNGVLDLIKRREKFFKEHPGRKDEWWLWN